jgi:VWFA-related protein
MSRKARASVMAVAVCCAVAVGLTARTARPSAAAEAAAQTSKERDMFVTVLTQAGAPVPNLQPDDFIVREDGVRREVLRAVRATDPIDVAVLVDNSQVAAPMVSDIRKGLEGFVAAVRELAEIAVITYGERPTLVTSYTKDPAALKQAVGRIFAIRGSGAYMLDGIQEVVKGLQKRESTRTAIVVLSAGGVEFSEEQADRVVRSLVDVGTSLNVITVGAGSSPSTEGDRQRDIVIDRGTSGTGGMRKNVLDQMGITRALDALATELLHQYRITYSRPDSLIPPESYAVGTRREGLVVRGTPVRDRRPVAR